MGSQTVKNSEKTNNYFQHMEHCFSKSPCMDSPRKRFQLILSFSIFFLNKYIPHSLGLEGSII